MGLHLPASGDLRGGSGIWKSTGLDRSSWLPDRFVDTGWNLYREQFNSNLVVLGDVESRDARQFIRGIRTVVRAKLQARTGIWFVRARVHHACARAGSDDDARADGSYTKGSSTSINWRRFLATSMIVFHTEGGVYPDSIDSSCCIPRSR
jgi:hypothetical protein